MKALIIGNKWKNTLHFLMILLFLLSCVNRNYLSQNNGRIRLVDIADDDLILIRELTEVQAEYYEKSCIAFGAMNINSATPIIIKPGDNYVITINGAYYVPDEYDGDNLNIDFVFEIEMVSNSQDSIVKISLDRCKSFIDYYGEDFYFGTNFDGEMTVWQTKKNEIYGQIIMDGLLQSNIILLADSAENYSLSSNINFVAKGMKTPAKGKVIMFKPKYYHE